MRIILLPEEHISYYAEVIQIIDSLLKINDPILKKDLEYLKMDKLVPKLKQDLENLEELYEKILKQYSSSKTLLIVEGTNEKISTKFWKTIILPDNMKKIDKIIIKLRERIIEKTKSLDERVITSEWFFEMTKHLFSEIGYTNQAVLIEREKEWIKLLQKKRKLLIKADTVIINAGQIHLLRNSYFVTWLKSEFGTRNISTKNDLADITKASPGFRNLDKLFDILQMLIQKHSLKNKLKRI